MMRSRVMTVVAVAAIGILGGAAAPPPAGGSPAELPKLVDIRAANHPTYDRLVFEFEGPLPTEYDVRFVSEVVQDGSGFHVRAAGDALLAVRFFPAVGHEEDGTGTYGPQRRTFPLPNLIQVNAAGDYEAVMTFAVGLAQAAPFRVSTLTAPSRIVIDIDLPERTVPVRVYFVDNNNMQQVRAVTRPVIPPATSRGALQRLFAGPTLAELASGLVLVDSGAAGFARVTIVDGVASVQLTDFCASGGSTTTIANEIVPTLKQFPAVQFVKIFDPHGTTQQPTGPSDSIPVCLEP